MTVSNETARSAYTANGTAADFSIGFNFKLNSDGTAQIKVYVNEDGTESLQVQGDDYVVDEDTGTVTFLSPPAAGSAVVILRGIPLVQDAAFYNTSRFPAEVYEEGLDNITHILQQQKERLDRAISLPPTASVTPQQFVSTIFTARDTALAAANTSTSAESKARRYANEAEDVIIEVLP